eukprot:1524566-Amphidinium_carterae.1
MLRGREGDRGRYIWTRWRVWCDATDCVDIRAVMRVQKFKLRRGGHCCASIPGVFITALPGKMATLEEFGRDLTKADMECH